MIGSNFNINMSRPIMIGHSLETISGHSNIGHGQAMLASGRSAEGILMMLG